MRRRSIVIGLLFASALAAGPVAVVARSGIEATDDRAVLEFPEKITFSVDLQSEAEIDEVVLEYGVEHLTCGDVIAKAFPEFEPSENVEVEWAWEMKKSGSLPPGAQVWWRWRVADAGGSELLTDRQTVTWLDDEYRWQTIGGDPIGLHWYEGSQPFAEELHQAAVDALARLERDAGLVPDAPVDLYIYGSTSDMRDAIYYEPGWTGGQAYTHYNIVIIGVAPENVEWGKDTVAHELTHVLVHRFTFSCLFSLPTWLDEGLAEFVERGDEGLGDDGSQFEAAVADDTLFSVRGLGGSFPEDPERAHLAYVQSYSVVDFLIAEYGQEKMLALLTALRDGAPIDDALEAIYGFDTDGLEDAWRAHVGAQPRVAGGAVPTPTPTPTVVPTYAPVAGVPLATLVTATLTPVATPAPTPTSVGTPAAGVTPTPDGLGGVLPTLVGGGVLTLVVALACVIVALALVVAVVFVRRRRGES